MAGQWHGNDIAFSLLQSLNHLGGILAFLHSQRYANLLGKLLAEQVLQTHAVVVIIIIGGRTVHGEHDELAVLLDIFQRETPLPVALSVGIIQPISIGVSIFFRTVDAIHFAHGSTPWRKLLLRFLVSAT